MANITRATILDAKLLSKLSTETFLLTHGHSAPKQDIKAYIDASFNKKVFEKELLENNIFYHFIYHQHKIAGYSKIVLNEFYNNSKPNNITYMSRLYLLKEFYGIGLGKKLMNFNISFSKKKKQKAIWLKVWVENQNAITFYKKTGFKIIGKRDFIISKNHSNPNHVMYLEL